MAGISRRKRIWGWWFFDWASQPYHTLLVTFIFGPYFAGVAAEYFLTTGLDEQAADARAQSVWSLCLAVTGLIIGFGAPLIGALADITGRRMPWIMAFSLMYVVGAFGLWWTLPDASTMWAMLILFGIGFVGAEYALIFINAQLPDLGSQQEIGKISGSGFAFGYLGGLVSLALMLALFVEQGNGKTLAGLDPVLGLDPAASEGTRSVGPFTAIWFAVFMIPYFLWFRDPPRSGRRASFTAALRLVIDSITALRQRISLAAYLGSSMFYRDALNGLYGFGGVYARLVLNWELTAIGIFGIVALISSALFSWVGGRLDTRFGPKPVITGSIWVLILVCVVIVSMSREAIFGIALEPGSNLPDLVFFGCGVLIGGMGGMLQSASRSLMVRHADPEAPTESFGLYGLSGRATAFVAPALIGLVTAASGNARLGVSPVIGLFVIGLVLLVWVKAEGDRTR
ncbi:MFS transporter [Pseudooceanicola lipolyticus]|uniref:MFS transporter n=1 Tax=Pseudooceanicola lipolyticus TaxID=2029104 RepID=A0A2M8J286_9RHOB|nr:MFS transporter [Pseudooceanicola lipolyticus]PJE36899.1 MFS transporter [Pseudooceanicola lipolyticus]